MRLGELALEAGLPEGLFQVITGLGLGRRAAVRVAPGRAQGRLHRVDRGRDGCRGRAAPARSSPSRSSSAARARTSSSRTPTSRRRPRRRPGAVFDNAGQDCCARSRILVQRSVFDRFLELLEPAVADWRVGDPHARDDRDGAAHLGGAPRHGRAVPRDARVAFRGSAPTGDGLLVRAGRRARPSRRRPDRAGRGLRTGRRGAAVRRRGRRHPARERHDLRTRRARSGPRTSAAQSASSRG